MGFIPHLHATLAIAFQSQRDALFIFYATPISLPVGLNPANQIPARLRPHQEVNSQNFTGIRSGLLCPSAPIPGWSSRLEPVHPRTSATSPGGRFNQLGQQSVYLGTLV